MGEDFLIAFDFDGNILWKFILEREDCFKKKANEEINVLINCLKEKDLVNKEICKEKSFKIIIKEIS